MNASGRREAAPPAGMFEWLAPGKCESNVAAFIDRDGVLNEHIAGGYVLGREDFRWLPGAADSMRRLAASGRTLIVVTNQSCINRGLLDERDFRAIMDEMIATLAAAGAPCAAWFCCPHRPDEGCACRKPGSLMLERAAERTGVRLARSVLIGDSPSDVGAAERVGMESMLIERNSPRAFAEAVDRVVGSGDAR